MVTRMMTMVGVGLVAAGLLVAAPVDARPSPGYVWLRVPDEVAPGHYWATMVDHGPVEGSVRVCADSACDDVIYYYEVSNDPGSRRMVTVPDRAVAVKLYWTQLAPAAV